MQLTPPPAPKAASALRARLGGAVCTLLAATAPAAARADATPKWQFDGTALVYSENKRTSVVEPIARITRLLSNGETFSLQFGLDAMTGASPTGALPAQSIQTITSASGQVTQQAVGTLPTNRFTDVRGVLDASWHRPILSTVATTLHAHASTERDYRSLGADGTLTVDVLQRLSTITIGGGYNHDTVMPTGGTRVGLSDSTMMAEQRSNPKRVRSGVLGLSRILSRGLLVAVTVGETDERGYLTDPYKVVSLLDSTGVPIGTLTEKRPDTRQRRHVLGSSVAHLGDDVLRLGYRYYWDDWGVRSHTLDTSLRRDFANGTWLEPRVRLYAQSAADFFRYGLTQGDPLPAYASSDERLGPLRTATFGATYGFHLPGTRGEFSLRAEWLHQFGFGRGTTVIGGGGGGEGGGDDAFEEGEEGGSRTTSLFPPLEALSIVGVYTVDF